MPSFNISCGNIATATITVTSSKISWSVTEPTNGETICLIIWQYDDSYFDPSYAELICHENHSNAHTGSDILQYPVVNNKVYLEVAFGKNVYFDDPGKDSQSHYLKTVSLNIAPTIPSSISVPSSIQDNNSINVSWGTSSDTDGNLSGYILQRRYNNGSWVQVYKGPNRSFSETAQSSWNTIEYRVCAYDTQNATSSYKASGIVTVTHNTPPVISGSDTNLGTFGMTKPNTYTYTITDAQNNVVTVTEKLDGVIKRTYNPTLGASNSFSFTDEEWLQVLNGNHTITIEASDGKASTTRTLTFTKKVDKIQFLLNPCLVASQMPSKAQESIIASIPDGSTCKVEICNNANDTSPTWEDITDKVLNDKKIFINNTIKTASEWGYNIRVTIDRGSATGPVWISGGSGFFE